MNQEIDHYRALLRLFAANTITPQETEELFSFLSGPGSDRVLLQELREEFQHIQNKKSTDGPFLHEARARLLQQIGGNKPVVRMRTRSWLRYAAAAAVVAVLALGSYFIVGQKTEQPVAVTPPAGLQQRFRNDVAPGGDKALLILDNGQSITLDEAGKGTLARQGGTEVVKLANGQLAYRNADGGTASVVYNTIKTPRGGQYQVSLPDGSQVWLNASSSLRFPTAFAGKERRVEVTGEVYFEVAKNARQPFIVSINGGSEVEVLGTQFNVMAYDDEGMQKTTLVEGSIHFRSGREERKLVPGQQAQLQGGGIRVADDVDVDQAVAWKNGLFDFNDDAIPDIMRQLARWYDIDVDYEGRLPDGHYVGAVRRKASLTEVLKMLELAGDVRFTIEGRKVTVRNQPR